MASPVAARSVPALRRRLLAWFDAHRRPLPWRDRSDAYAVWVSEVMLQQTRVETVLPYYRRWLERFPDVHALAAASEREVLAAWSGLGYYSRARNLHRAAQVVVAEHGGVLPSDPAELLRLPGIGPYTAGAVASIAFGVAAPAVDGNAVRVVARLTGERRVVSDGAVRCALEVEAGRLVARTRPGDWNQAVMELGATLCTPRAPRCGRCPVARWCAARSDGAVQKIPRTAAKRVPAAEAMHFALIERDGRLLFVERPAGGLLAGTLGLPGGPVGRPLARLVSEQVGLKVRKGRLLGAAEHRFTHRHWSMRVHACTLVDEGARRVPGAAQRARWVALDALEREPVSSALRKALVAAGC